LNLEALRAEFIKTYAAVPAKLRSEIIALVSEKPYNWDTSYIEISNKTQIGDEILKHLVQIKLLSEKG